MSRVKHILSDGTGQALVISALGLSTLLGFMALAIDTGVLFQAKRKLQTAADAAATAGALDYLYNASVSSATTAAANASSLNGYTNGSGGVVVSVSVPPADGPNAGNKLFVEAVVTKPVPTFFMRLFGFSTVSISARAVAGTPTSGQACIWVMAPSGPSMELQGSYDIEAPGCGIYVNSPSSQAFSDIGNGGTVNAAFLDVVGNSPPAHQTSPTSTTINAAPRTSPWGDFDGDSLTNCDQTVPAAPSGGTTSITTSNANSVVGQYLALGKVVCFEGPVTFQDVSFGSATGNGKDANGNTIYTGGVLLFEKGLTLGGTVSLYGTPIDLYDGTFTQGNATLNVVAPTSGSFAGLAVVMSQADKTSTCQDPKTTTPCLQLQFGSSNSVLEGYIYAPGAQVYMQDNGGGITASGIIANTLYEKSSPLNITTSYDSMFPGVTPNRVVTLVE